MSDHDEILIGFKQFVEARKVFAKYEGIWFSGNDNHVGDIGEYWSMRYFASKKPKLAPNRTSPYDIELANGKKYSIKTMSRWNKSGRGSPVKGIDEGLWDYLITVRLNDDLAVEKFCIVPRSEMVKRIKERDYFTWWPWLEEFEVPFILQ